MFPPFLFISWLDLNARYDGACAGHQFCARSHARCWDAVMKRTTRWVPAFMELLACVCVHTHVNSCVDVCLCE